MSDPSQEVMTVDARGLLCPLPVIRTQETIKQLPPGTILKVLATDPGSLEDIPAWCRVHGHTVLETRRERDNILLVLRV
ncbi:MAG: sulfurtransferase TusA family protein [Pseudomonadota bacterium]|nr:sulfurtransferase TusA family protein [Pseudomonadota bacterium]MEC8867778.1 sulfurtransferase TusA family protein [Pseudomonadota bacterium]MEC9285315.1 sulfurtransferase TusA family protein [Pseudomonadota bacterium]MEE3182493.1 sulfurtransferase TusA family protein [Pseudomonadota bacterium]|tara:strand:+ start:68 stop:304 length:237 start_codon:yes stop_codon:yes gene_type:complete